MKNLIKIVLIVFACTVVACDHIDDDKKGCSKNLDKLIVLCKTMPGDDQVQKTCIDNAVLSSCSIGDYWKGWGCADGKPCM